MGAHPRPLPASPPDRLVAGCNDATGHRAGGDPVAAADDDLLAGRADKDAVSHVVCDGDGEDGLKAPLDEGLCGMIRIEFAVQGDVLCGCLASRCVSLATEPPSAWLGQRELRF